MHLEQLMGRYFRLKQELAIAYNAQPWQSRRIDRLANELAATEREIAAMQPPDEQCSEPIYDLMQMGAMGRSATGPAERHPS